MGYIWDSPQRVITGLSSKKDKLYAKNELLEDDNNPFSRNPQVKMSGVAAKIQQNLNTEGDNDPIDSNTGEIKAVDKNNNKGGSFISKVKDYLFSTDQGPKTEIIDDVPYTKPKTTSRLGSLLGLTTSGILGAVSGAGAIPAMGETIEGITEDDYKEQKAANDAYLRGVYQKNQLDVQKQSLAQKAAQQEKEAAKDERDFSFKKGHTANLESLAKTKARNDFFKTDLGIQVNDIITKAKMVGASQLTPEEKALLKTHRKTIEGLEIDTSY